jgi:DNA topoisomerase-1
LPRNLVIVESPSKATTIKKFLGPDFDVMASVGHVVDLPKKGLGVDTRKNFMPKYVVVPGKEKLLSDLRKASRAVDQVYLAPDPDREGEAISWHLANALEIEHPLRAVFNEITKTGVTEGIAHPREIDERLVNAQQARRVLDRLVGYKISPLLWRKVLRGTSAGRVQSVALRLICDREEERLAFIPEEYWTIEADVTKQKPKRTITANLLRQKDQKDKERLTIHSGDEARAVTQNVTDATWEVAAIEAKKTRSAAPGPFNTSSMQQDSSNKLRFAPKKTMRVAQSLYEGIDLGGERVGVITYMRTDSTRIAPEAQVAVRKYIESTFGKQYIGPGPRTKEKPNVQGAHEAIRPTDVNRTPDSIKNHLSADEFKLYNLIWRRFVASFMAPAVFDSTRVLINVGDFVFAANGSVIIFQGHYAVTVRDEKDTTLPELTVGEVLDLQKLTPEQHFTEPLPRFTEASLIKELEERGIGRPSTYVPIISTIVDRKYVKVEQRRFEPLELGMKVNEVMKAYFPRIVDVGFTAEIETELDRVEEGVEEWSSVIRDFYEPFKTTLAEAEKTMEAVEWPVVTLDEICPECGKVNLVIKHGRFGEFISCSNYPECTYSRQILDTLGIPCPDDGGELIRRRSKRGRIFYGCANFPKCKWASWDEPIPEPCPVCGGLQVRSGRNANAIKCTRADQHGAGTVAPAEATREPDLVEAH